MPVSFNTTHGELSVALDAMTALITSRPPLPALANLRIVVLETGVVAIESYDYDTHVSVMLKAQINTPFPTKTERIIVNRAELTAFIRSLTKGTTRARQAGLPITIAAEKGIVEVVTDGYSMSLPTPDEFVEPPASKFEFQAENFATVDRDALLTAITRLQVSAGHDETLPMLTGISFESVEGGLELATTDRFRLGVAFLPTAQSGHEIKRLIPAKMLSTICRHLPAGEIWLDFADLNKSGLAYFRSGAFYIGTRFLDSEFVKYRSLIPGKGRGDAVVSRNQLVMALKRASSLLDNGRHVRLRLHGSTAMVTGGFGGDGGKVASPMFRTTQTGEDLEGEIAFNPKYLGQALASFGSDSVAIRYSTPSKPVLIAEPGELDNPRAFRTMLMPAKLPA